MANLEKLVDERLTDANELMDLFDGASEDYMKAHNVFKEVSHTELELRKLELERDIKTRELDIREGELQESKKKRKWGLVGKIVVAGATLASCVYTVFMNVNQGKMAGDGVMDKFTKSLEKKDY